MQRCQRLLWIVLLYKAYPHWKECRERPVKICETDIRWLSWRGSGSENMSGGTLPYIHTGSFFFNLKR